MNIFLYIGLWILLTVEFVDGMRCSQCNFQRPGKPCSRQKDPCKLSVGESCYKQTVYFGRMPLYIKKGCQLYCKKIVSNKISMSLSEDFICCSWESFCNS